MSGRELDRDNTDSYHPDHPWEQVGHPLYLRPSLRHKGNWPPKTPEPLLSHGESEMKYWMTLPPAPLQPDYDAGDPVAYMETIDAPTLPRHAGEPRRTRKPLVRAKINMARVLAIGEELAQLSAAASAARTAYTNDNMAAGEQDWWASKLYEQISNRRTALREELRKMG